MCRFATQTAASLLKAIEPTLVAFLNLEGIANSKDGLEAIAAYNAAYTALASWKSGTDASNVIELLTDLSTVLQTLPIPATDLIIFNLILGGVEGVIAVVTANSPAATEEDLAQSKAEIAVLAPTFKRKIFTPAAKQYTDHWNTVVTAAGGKYLALKVAV